MNHLAELTHLKNRYLAMRHGHSLANLEGIVVSDPAHGLDQFGLSELGRAQVESSLAGEKDLDRNTRIVSSDFKRARESAEIVHRFLGCVTPLQLDARLRERYFGQLELGSDRAYDEVWQQDSIDPDHSHRDGETANQVMARVTSLVLECEQRYSGATILMVSHGDALQILQTAFAGRNASRHRQLRQLQTAEIRRLNR